MVRRSDDIASDIAEPWSNHGDTASRRTTRRRLTRATAGRNGRPAMGWRPVAKCKLQRSHVCIFNGPSSHRCPLRGRRTRHLRAFSVSSWLRGWSV